MPRTGGLGSPNCLARGEKFPSSSFDLETRDGGSHVITLRSRYIVVKQICNECTDYAEFPLVPANFKTHPNGDVSYSSRAFELQSNFTHAEG